MACQSINLKNKLKKILIAEDNLITQKVYQSMLSAESSYLLTFAINGLEAFKKCTKNVAAILMDVDMPKMNGIEATKRIRAHFNKDIPIIGVTAHVDDDIKKECLAAGMNQVLEKPLWKDRLTQVLNQCVAS